MSGAPRKIPNPLTAFRLFSLPVLWFFALSNQQQWLAIGLALAAISDVLDGRLARKWPQFEDGRFDSLADKFLTISVIAWLVMLKSQLLLDHWLLVSGAAAIYAVSLLLGWFKHGRLTSLHTHLGKLGGLLQAIFAFHAFFTSSFSLPLFYLAVGSFWIAAIEEVWIQWVYDEIDDEVVRSIIPYLREQTRK